MTEQVVGTAGQHDAFPHDVDFARSVLDSLPMAVYTTDATGRITYYNEAAALLWGRSPDLDAGASWCGSWKLYWPDGRAMAHDECPMAVSMRTGQAVRGAEAIAERPDGSRVSFVPYPTPLFDASGALVGGVNMLVDITDRKRADEYATRLAAIVDSSDDAIISKDLRGVILSWNAGAERLFGYNAAEVIGKPVTILIPEDRQNEEPGIIGRIVRGERVDHYETIRRRKDGSLVDISLTVSPIKIGGTIIGASKIARDITDRKRADEQANLLIDEMKHRLKNALSIVQAIASQTLSSVTAEEQAAFAARLQVLGGAQELLTLKNLKSVPLREVIERALAPFRQMHAERLVLDGEGAIWLDARRVTLLSMGLHELATNAAKYGALSNDAGIVRVTWRVMAGDDGRRVSLVWQESDGPAVAPRRRKGFGSLLLEQALQSDLDSSTLEFRPEGVVCAMELTV